MKRKLSLGRSRADIITGYRFAAGDAPAAPAAASGPYEPKPYDQGTDELVVCPQCEKHNDTDASYCDQCGFDLTSTGETPAPYKQDPDETVVCPNCQKHDDTDASYCDQCGFKLAGAEGVTIETPDATPAPDAPASAASAAAPTAGTPAAAEVPKASPVDTDGNVDPTATCANPDCGHMASVHQDLDTGQNSGACTTVGCTCPAMQIEAVGTDDNAPSVVPADTSGDPANTVDDQTGRAGITSLASGPEGEAAPVEGPASTSPPTTVEPNLPPELPGGDSMGPAFTIPVAIIEGQPTGDGREIALEALTWRVPPLPLMGLATETHDPEGWDLNDPAVICGRIDSFARVPGEAGTQLIEAHGFYLPNDDGMYFAEMNEAMGRLGISADVAVDASQISIEGVDDDGWPTEMSDVVTAGTIMGLTVCPYPAFEGAYIVLGDGTNAAPAAIPQATEPVPAAPAVVAAGGQLIHFMTFEECGSCSGTDVIVASGGPVAPPAAWFANPHFTMDDDRLAEIVVTDPKTRRKLAGRYVAPMQVTEEGRVFGHIAPWDACHVGITNKCVVAPHSNYDYADFKRTQHVVTAEGEKVRTGVITAGLGHAGMNLRATAAMAHYDDTRYGCADVAIGEDEFGIWVAGALRPTATPEQVRMLRASGISGDWRDDELVALLAVNEPGFPMAVVASGHRTLIAAGASVMYAVAHPKPMPPEGDVALRRALAPMLGEAKGRARERIAAL